jgi:hypothetical protein
MSRLTVVTGYFPGGCNRDQYLPKYAENNLHVTDLENLRSEIRKLDTINGNQNTYLLIMTFVNASPYKFPFDGNLTKDNTALVIIDMQNDCILLSMTSY